MKKLLFIIFGFILFTACDKEDAPNCFQTTGDIIQQEIKVEAFEELIVYDRVKLFIEQGPTHKIVVEAGKNLINNVSAVVEDGRLSLRNSDNCNLFREYNTTKIYVTVPNLTWLQNASNNTIESVGTLNFPVIWIRSLNQEKDPGIYTNGDFKLNLVSDFIRVTGDEYSNYFLSGSTSHLNLFIADGDGRFEGKDLISGIVEIQHRGTNKLFVNPQNELKGEIRSTGDVISVNRPPIVNLPSFYTGKLIFQAP